MVQLISILGNLASGYLASKQEEKQAIHERRLQEIKNGAEWDTTQAANAQASWKDEWFTILFSIPLVLAFIPDFVPHIMKGFEVLENMPDWYKAFLGASVAASFGIKSLSQWRK